MAQIIGDNEVLRNDAGVPINADGMEVPNDKDMWVPLPDKNGVAPRDGVDRSFNTFELAVCKAIEPYDYDLVWGIYEEQIIKKSTAYIRPVPTGPDMFHGPYFKCLAIYEMQLVRRIPDFTDMREIYTEFFNIFNKFMANMAPYGQIDMHATNVHYRPATVGDTQDDEYNEKYLVAEINYVTCYYLDGSDK